MPHRIVFLRTTRRGTRVSLSNKSNEWTRKDVNSTHKIWHLIQHPRPCLRIYKTWWFSLPQHHDQVGRYPISFQPFCPLFPSFLLLMNINWVILTKVPHVMFEFPTPTQLSQLCVINISNVGRSSSSQATFGRSLFMLLAKWCWHAQLKTNICFNSCIFDDSPLRERCWAYHLSKEISYIYIYI